MAESSELLDDINRSATLQGNDSSKSLPILVQSEIQQDKNELDLESPELRSHTSKVIESATRRKEFYFRQRTHQIRGTNGTDL